MEFVDAVRRIKDTITKKSPSKEVPQGNIRFPLSPWQHLRPDVKEGPLSRAIGGKGVESLFNAVSDGVVTEGDVLHVTYSGKDKNGSTQGRDLYYVCPSQPLFDPKGKDPAPRHILYSPSAGKMVLVTGGQLTGWTKFGADQTLPEEVRTAINNYKAGIKHK